MDFHKFETLIHEIKCTDPDVSALDLFIPLYRRVHELSFCEDDINKKALLVGKSFVSLFKLADKLGINSALFVQDLTIVRKAIKRVEDEGIVMGKNDFALFTLAKLATLSIVINNLPSEKGGDSNAGPFDTLIVFKKIEGLIVTLATYAIKNDIDINDSIEKAMIRKEEV